MNRIFLQIILFLIIELPVANAQRVFHFGVEAGINGSQISGDTYSGYNQPGIYAGIYSRVNFREIYSLQSGFALSQKGSRKIPNPERGDYNEYYLRLNYIEVPVVLRVDLKKIIGETGLYGAYLNSYSEDNQFGPVVPVRPFNKTEFGGYIGAGFKIKTRGEFVVRASNSLAPVRKHISGTSFRWNLGQYNAALTFMFRYTFEGKERVI